MDNFNFDLIDKFSGYNSSVDKTNLNETFLVRGSKNVYKKLSGTIASRFGLKRRGTADSTVAAVKSSYEWNTSLGTTRVLRVANAKFQVESLLLNASTLVWYDLMTSLSTLTRFVFDTMWDNTLKKDRLVFVRGDTNLYSWSGGVTKVASGTSTTLIKSDTTTSWIQDGFDNDTLATIGDATTNFDITNTAGSTYRYTWDGTGTDPAITAISVPVGTYVYLNGQNFNTVNKGVFVVTASAANYFEITNASGIAEANKTIGNGAVYVKFTKVLYIGSTFYGYTGGETTSTLTGVFPDATAVIASVAVQSPITWANTPTSSGFTNDFVKNVNKQLAVGCYKSRIAYLSGINDFSSTTAFTVPAPRLAGSPELLFLDDNVNGFGLKDGDWYISAGTSSWYKVTFLDITVNTTLQNQTKVIKQSLANRCAAYAHEFIDNSGDDIVYLSQDQQLRTVGTFRNLPKTKFPSLSQAVQSELSEEDFTGGHLRVIGDFTHITAPNNGRDWMYQVRESPDSMGNIVSERLWHPPQLRNIQRFAVIAGVKYGHSNANPQIYQVEDTAQWHDDGPTSDLLPYECTMKMAYRHLKTKEGVRRQGKVSGNMLYTEGYMANGVNLFGQLNWNYRGASGIVSPVINSVASPARFYTGENAPSMGDSSLGDNPLGDGLTPESNDQELLPKFFDIADLTPTDCFEYQISIYSIDPDSRWEILSLGINAKESPIQAVELRRNA